MRNITTVRSIVRLGSILVLTATATSAIEATREVAAANGVASETLWKHVPRPVKGVPNSPQNVRAKLLHARRVSLSSLADLDDQ